MADKATKNLAKLERRDYLLLRAALAQMEENPFGGDLQWLKNHRPAYRRRVGSYRILFDIFNDSRFIKIQDIRRRKENTYRKRR